MTSQLQPIVSIAPLMHQYDALLLDLWGVVHDGSHLYPGIAETLAHIRDAEKKIIFISNAPRRAERVIEVLDRLGIKRQWYDHVVTSGDAGYEWLKNGHATWGKRYYYIGPPKDEGILDGLDFIRTDALADCDFLLNVGFGTEEQSSQDWHELLVNAAAQKISMLCLNPDFEVVKISGERYPCAGVLAADYQGLRGHVRYFGKPFPEVYEACMKWLAPIPKSRILAVGDGIVTDIAGARAFGIDAALVTGGIIQKRESEVEALCKKHNAVPNYVMPALVW